MEARRRALSRSTRLLEPVAPFLTVKTKPRVLARALLVDAMTRDKAAPGPHTTALLKKLVAGSTHLSD